MNTTLLYNGLPLFPITIDDEQSGMTCISLVDEPAVEHDFLCFKKELKFSTDESKHIVTGVAIVADMPIYRRDGDFEYYVVFTKDTIRDIVEQYSREQLWNTVSLQHDGIPVNEVYCVEMYLKDTERGIAPKGFDDVSDGSLFCTFKIEDEQLWQSIVNGDTINGFSIEVTVDWFKKTERGIDLSVGALLGDVSRSDESRSDKKKVEFLNISQLEQLMAERQVANLTINGNSTLTNAQVQSIGTQNGHDVAIIYADGLHGKQWYIYRTKQITNIRPSNAEWVEFNYDVPSYKAISEVLDNITVTKTEVVLANDIEGIIRGRKWVVINYNDEREDPATGARQCMVVAWGNTLAGNECIRVYERYGDSREGDIPNYRLMLTGRILSLRVLDWMEPWTDADLDDRYNWAGDNSMQPVRYWYHGE